MFKKKKIKKIEICIQKSLHFFFYCEYHLELNEHIFLGSFWKYVCALYFNRCNRIKLSFDFVKTKPTSENPATLCWHIVSFIWNLWIIIVCNNKGKKIQVRLGGGILYFVKRWVLALLIIALVFQCRSSFNIMSYMYELQLTCL